VDTAQPAPDDASGDGSEPLPAQPDRYLVQGRSLVVLSGA